MSDELNWGDSSADVGTGAQGMSEPSIQCQPDTPDCLVNSAWVKWASTTVNELEAQVAEHAETIRLAQAMLDENLLPFKQPAAIKLQAHLESINET